MNRILNILIIFVLLNQSTTAMKTQKIKTKEITFIDGFSESAWKSLVVKSLRIGWVNGLQEASKKISKSTMESLLLAGLFEDVFPGSWKELDNCILEIKSGNYKSLCERNTHHGRGYTDAFCDLENEAVEKGRSEGYELMKEVQNNSSLRWLNPRVFNCLYTWMKIKPNDENSKRAIMTHQFSGMPECILDGHTYEGKCSGRRIGLLSGHYSQHREIGKLVSFVGHWGIIRKKFLSENIVPVNVQIEMQFE